MFLHIFSRKQKRSFCQASSDTPVIWQHDPTPCESALSSASIHLRIILQTVTWYFWQAYWTKTLFLERSKLASQQTDGQIDKETARWRTTRNCTFVSALLRITASGHLVKTLSLWKRKWQYKSHKKIGTEIRSKWQTHLFLYLPKSFFFSHSSHFRNCTPKTFHFPCMHVYVCSHHLQTNPRTYKHSHSKHHYCIYCWKWEQGNFQDCSSSPAVLLL